MNTNCDHCDGDCTSGEVRKIPTVHGGNILACRYHFFKEMLFRNMRNKELKNPKAFEIEKWSDCEIYENN